MIDRQTVDKIMAAANIVDVVGEFVTLRKAGVNYKGLCPFHDEKTPSFIVSPARGTCHCFGCGKGGNAVGFLMEHEQMSYPEALRWLARKYNIEIVEKELTAEEKQHQSDRESMFIVNEWAMDYFQDILYNNIDGKAIGMQYFRSRGFRDDIIKKFQLGYSLNSRNALAEAGLKRGYQEQYLVSTGLCYKQDDGRLHDRYYGRVIFPWISVSGKVCAFGGRLLDSRTKGVSQKYVNSPESEIYHKSQELYGIFQAKRAIAKENLVYMVEGYTDVISMHQCGIENVVANSGTALSIEQIRLLRRFTPNIILLYDGDSAGKHAALRGTDMLLAEGMNIKIVLLPESDDPDSFARTHTAEEFEAYIQQNKTDFIVFKIQLMLEGVTDLDARSEAINSIVKSISMVRDPIKRDTYLRECAQRTGASEKSLIRALNNFIHEAIEERKKKQTRAEELGAKPADRQQAPSLTSAAHNTTASETMTPEYLLTEMVVRYGDEVMYDNLEMDDGSVGTMNVAEYINFDLESEGMQFQTPLYRKILELAVGESVNDGFKAAQFFTHHEDLDISQTAIRMVTGKYYTTGQQMRELVGDRQELIKRVEHLMMDFKFNHYQQKLKQLMQKLRAGDTDGRNNIMKEISACQESRNFLAKELGINIKK